MGRVSTKLEKKYQNCYSRGKHNAYTASQYQGGGLIFLPTSWCRCISIYDIVFTWENCLDFFFSKSTPDFQMDMLGDFDISLRRVSPKVCICMIGLTWLLCCWYVGRFACGGSKGNILFMTRFPIGATLINTGGNSHDRGALQQKGLILALKNARQNRFYYKKI